MSKELLFSLTAKDFRVDYYRPTGNGGQKVNKTSSACRITHIESGAVGASQDHREQSRNKREAFDRLLATKVFQNWHKRKSAEMMLKLQGLKSLEQQVEDSMNEKNLKVDVQVDGKWIPESSLTNE